MLAGLSSYPPYLGSTNTLAQQADISNPIQRSSQKSSARTRWRPHRIFTKHGVLAATKRTHEPLKQISPEPDLVKPKLLLVLALGQERKGTALRPVNQLVAFLPLVRLHPEGRFLESLLVARPPSAKKKKKVSVSSMHLTKRHLGVFSADRNYLVILNK